MSDDMSGREVVRDQPGQSWLDLDRREFIGGSAAAVALAGAAAAASIPVVDVSKPGRVTVSLAGSPDWVIDQAMFSRSGLLPLSVRGDPAALEVSLAHATFHGSSLSPDFRAQIVPAGAGWNIQIDFEEIAGRLTMPLTQWMASLASAGPPPRMGPAANSRLRIGQVGVWWLNGMNGARVGFRADFSGQIIAAAGSALDFGVMDGYDRGFTAVAHQVNFERRAAMTPEAFAGVSTQPQNMFPGTGENTFFTFDKPELRDGSVSVGRIKPDMRVAAAFFSPSVEISAFAHAKGLFANSDAYVRISAADGALAVFAGGAGPNGARVQFERPLVEFTQFGMPDRMQVSGTIARRIHGVEARAFAVMIEGGEGFSQNFPKRPLGNLSIRTSLVGAHVPLDRGASADGCLGPISCEMLFQDYLKDPRRWIAGPSRDALVWIGRDDAALEMPLERTNLRISRCRDLFNLTFRFRNYALSCSSAGTLIRHRKVEGDVPLLVVEFPPQNVFEQAFQPPVDSGAPPKDGRTPLAQADRAKTLLAKSSRLVFKDSVQEWERDRPLTVDYLTDWRAMAMAVNPRATRANITLPEQLRLIGIVPRTTRVEALGLVRGQMKSPDEFQTAIEPVYRLIVSPDENAKWILPAVPANGIAPEVWSARLDPASRPTVRALWARGMKYSVFAQSQVVVHPPCTDGEFFAGSLSHDDRAEIVAQSSMYGLAALRRLKVVHRDDGKADQVAEDDPAGMVFVPQGQPPEPSDYQYLTQKFEGVMTPKPFAAFALMLSRGATLKAEWKGEPPAPADADGNGFFEKAFSVERYLHRVQDGRDTFVEVFYKGFLLPFGHRVSWLKLTQREFHPYEGTNLHKPVAYLIQHMYVVCHVPVKTFPAYNHPFAGNDCAPRSVTLLTTLTPDLVNPVSFPDGLVISGASPLSGVAGRENGCLVPVPGAAPVNQYRVAWPTQLNAKTGKKEVFFQFLVDGDKTPARMPMLFVDNAASHDPAAMKAIVTWYNNTIDVWRRTASHDGAQRRYAPETKGGECTFATNSWQMKVHGVVTHDAAAKAASESFLIDAFMEGADQIPAYPYVDIANISIEPVNRLIGVRNLPVDVSYSPRYTLNGFDTGHNPAQIYLDVLGTPLPDNPATRKPVYLDARSDGKATGGVAKPNALLSALSRSKGPIGGRPGNAPQNSSTTSIPQEAAKPSYSSALSGRFDPLEYFGAALGEAKLLGVVALKDILKAVAISAAPELAEEVQYQADAAAGELDAAMRKALKQLEVLKDPVGGAMADLGGIKDTNGNSLAPQLYPRLYQVLSTLDGFLHALDGRIDGIKPEDLPKLFDLATEAVRDVQDVIAELRSVARDPMPANVRNDIAKLMAAWQTIRAGGLTVQSILDGITRSKGGVSPLQALCVAAVKAGLFELLFGPLEFEGGGVPLFNGTPPSPGSFFPLPGPVNKSAPDVQDRVAAETFKALVEGEAQSLPRQHDALFAPTIGQPVLRVLAAARAFAITQKADAVNNVIWSRRLLAEKVMDLLRFKIAGAITPQTAVHAHAIVGQVNAVWDAILAQGGGLENLPTALYDAVAKLDFSPVIKALYADVNGEIACAIKARDDAKAQAGASLDKLDYDNFRKWTAEANARAIYITALIGLRDILQDTKDGKRATFKLSKNTSDAFTSGMQKAVQDLVTDAVKEVQDAISRYARDQVASVTSQVTQIVAAVMDHGLGVCETLVADLNGKMQEACAAGRETFASFAVAAAQLATGVSGDLDTVYAALSVFGDQLADIRAAVFKLPAATNDNVAVQELETRLATLATTQQKLIQHVDELQRIALVIGPAPLASSPPWPPASCADLNGLLTPVARAIQLRYRAVHALSNAAADIAAAYDAEGLLQSRVNVDSLVPLVRAMLPTISAIGGYQRTPSAVAAFLNPPHKAANTDLAAQLSDQIAKVTKAATDLATDIGNSKSKDAVELVQLAGRCVTFTEDQDQAFAARFLQVCLSLTGFAQALSQQSIAILIATATLMQTVTKTAEDGVKSVQDVLQYDDGALASLFPKKTLGELAGLGTALQTDDVGLGALIQDLRAVNTAPGSVAQYRKIQSDIKALVQSWTPGGPAAIKTLTACERVVNGLAAGNIKSLIDVDALQDKLEKQIEALIPAQVNLSYDFDAALPDYPPGDPIFMIDEDQDPELANTPSPINDLVIKTHVRQNLLTGERQVEGHGQIRPFKIHLLGDALDLATIKFSGATFDLAADGKVKFHADVSGLEIGSALEFLSALQKLLAAFGAADGDDEGDGDEGSDDGTADGDAESADSGGTNGFFHHLSLSPPQFVVGYGFNEPFLPMGPILLQNIGFTISALLPLDDRQAEFRFTFATATKPFLVSMPPYGGGGFVGIRANARGVIGLEIQMEFGAVVPIHFGPLSGSGRITAGIYMLSYSDGDRRLEGFVHAVGEGHIACFGLAILLEVRTIQVNNTMEGTATYAFTFSVGMFSVSYAVTVHTSQEGSKRQQSTSVGADTEARLEDRSPRPAGIHYANLPSGETGGLRFADFVVPALDRPAATFFVRTVAPRKSQEWAAYASHVDI